MPTVEFYINDSVTVEVAEDQPITVEVEVAGPQGIPGPQSSPPASLGDVLYFFAEVPNIPIQGNLSLDLVDDGATMHWGDGVGGQMGGDSISWVNNRIVFNLPGIYIASLAVFIDPVYDQLTSFSLRLIPEYPPEPGGNAAPGGGNLAGPPSVDTGYWVQCEMPPLVLLEAPTHWTPRLNVFANDTDKVVYGFEVYVVKIG